MTGEKGQSSPYFDPNRGYNEQMAERLAANRAVFERLGSTASSIVHHELPVEAHDKADTKESVPVDPERVAGLTAEAKLVLSHFQSVVEEIRSFSNRYGDLLEDIDADDDFFIDQPLWARELIELGSTMPDVSEIVTIYRSALEPIEQDPQQ